MLLWSFLIHYSDASVHIVGYIGYIFQRKIWWHVCVCRYIFQRKIDGIYVGLYVCVLKISFQLNFVMQRTDIQFSLSSHTFGFRCSSTWMIFHVLQTSFTLRHTLSFYLRCECHTQFKAIFLDQLYFSFKWSIYFIDIYVAKYVMWFVYTLLPFFFSVWSIFFLLNIKSFFNYIFILALVIHHFKIHFNGYIEISMEKAMAPHSSTLAWKIPRTEEPGRLQSMGLRRVRHDWATSLSLFTFMHWRRKWQPTPVFLPGESQGWGILLGCCLWGRTESDTT